MPRMDKSVAIDKVALWLFWAGRNGVGTVWGEGDGQRGAGFHFWVMERF